jgi:hypothetical protein
VALKASETWKSGSGGLGLNAWDEYSCWIWGNPLPLAQGGDNADDPGQISLGALPLFSIISEMGNVFCDFNRERVSPGRWLITAKYKSPIAVKQTGDATFAFQIGGGTTHISSSIATKGSYAPSGQTAPNHNNAINVGADGAVGGVDIPTGSYSFRTTFYTTIATLNAGYLNELNASVGQFTNSDEVTINVNGFIQVFQPGSLRIKSVSGQERAGFGDVEMSLDWEYAPNTTSPITIGSGSNQITIPGGVKNGFDYLWTQYLPASISGTTMDSIPIAAYVEQVLTPVPLSGLVLPNSFNLSNIPGWGGTPIYPGLQSTLFGVGN